MNQVLRKSSIYYFLIFIIIISNIYLGKYKIIGNYSIRVPILLLTIIYVAQYKRFFRINSYILLTIMYVLGYFLSTLANSSDLNYFFNTVLISNFLFSVLFYFIILNTKDIRRAIKILVYLLAINSVFLIGQFLNIEFFWIISKLLFLLEDDSFSKSMDTFQKSKVIEGLVGTVYSGYLIVTIIPFSFYLLKSSNNRLIIVLLIIVTTLSSFFLQQRGAFYLTILSIVVSTISFKKLSSHSIILLGILSIISIAFLNYFITNLQSTSRLTDLTDESRFEMINNSLQFCFNNPLWGGFDRFYVFNKNRSPHNIFFNSWIRGGLIGLIAISIILFKATFRSIKYIKSQFNKKSIEFYSSLALLNVIALSITHNAGFATGDILHYVALALLLNTSKKTLTTSNNLI